jgi:hypothetical protein
MTGAPLQDALLDDAQIGELLFDIAHAAQVVGVTLRPLGVRRADPCEHTLDGATAALRARTASVQLRYRFRGEEWWDTLIPAGSKTRLVRINHTRARAPEE